MICHRKGADAVSVPRKAEWGAFVGRYLRHRASAVFQQVTGNRKLPPIHRPCRLTLSDFHTRYTSSMSSPPMKQAENGTAMESSSEPTASSAMHAGREAAMPRETNKDNLITVEPLKRSEMQPSYAQTLPIDEVQGFYGSMINCLGAFAGTLGSIPLCFCCPNPYKEVRCVPYSLH